MHTRLYPLHFFIALLNNALITLLNIIFYENAHDYMKWGRTTTINLEGDNNFNRAMNKKKVAAIGN